jgi:hypothetical protein
MDVSSVTLFRSHQAAVASVCRLIESPVAWWGDEKRR